MKIILVHESLKITFCLSNPELNNYFHQEQKIIFKSISEILWQETI